MNYKCEDCENIFSSRQALDKHKSKKYNCKEAPFRCKHCKAPFYSRSSKYTHQKKCQGLPETAEQKDKRISDLQIALAASSGLNNEIKEKQIIQQAETINNISIDQINNVTQNIIIVPCGQEKIQHLQNISFDDIKKKIGLDRTPQTHIEAYKLIHLDPKHPENQNLLLTDKNSSILHFYGNDHTWRQGPYDDQMRLAIYDTNDVIKRLIPEKERGQYFDDHLVYGIGAKCNLKDDVGLKPIFDGIRGPLHEATKRLLMGKSAQEQADKIMAESQASDTSTLSEQVLIEREITKRQQMQTDLRKLELEIELAKIKNQSVAA